MDPEDTLYMADQAVSDCNSYEAHAALQNYREWRASGGFEPLHLKNMTGRGDEVARAIATRLEDLDRQSAAGFHAFLAAFPQTERNYGTGGGCTAWIIEKTKGGKYILLTDDNLTQPCMSDAFVSVGSYDAEGETISDARGAQSHLLTWDEARAWVAAELARL